MKNRWSQMILPLLLGGCTGLPDQVQPVANFDAQRYLGSWYEIARLDHSFERGLEQVTANYAQREDGGIEVTNRGYQAAKSKWKQVTGKAYFVGDRSLGHLKVSFFGPFYSSYVIFDLSDDYQTAYIAGFNHDYLWMLSRTPQVSDQAKQRFAEMAGRKGFAVEQIIWVEQASAPPR